MLIALLVVLAACQGDTTWDVRSRLPKSLADEEPAGLAPVDAPEENAEPEPQYIPPRPRTPSSGGGLQFSIGPAGGYLHAKGADRGTWFVGGQARLHFLMYFAVEASATFHENSYEHGDIHVTQYPLQLSGMIYPFPMWIISPYLVGGGGWYYTKISYTGSLASISNETDHTFGAHGGVGADVRLGASITIDADLRYIFLNPSTSQVKDGDFNYWQVTFGLNFSF
jgi:hypothetical protein